MNFNIGSGYAAMDEVGNEAEDLHFSGGDYGIVTTATSPSWQYTLLDSTFEGQRIAAFKTHNTGLTLVRDEFKNMPTVVSIDENDGERLWMKNCRLENITGPAVIVGEEDNERHADQSRGCRLPKCSTGRGVSAQQKAGSVGGGGQLFD